VKCIASITTSEYVKSLSLLCGGRLIALQQVLYAEYYAVIGRGEERPLDPSYADILSVLASLMRRVGRALKSDYYSFVGVMEVEPERITFEPHVTPELKARIRILPKRVRVLAGEYRKTFRLKEGELSRIIELMNKLVEEVRG